MGKHSCEEEKKYEEAVNKLNDLKDYVLRALGKDVKAECLGTESFNISKGTSSLAVYLVVGNMCEDGMWQAMNVTYKNGFFMVHDKYWGKYLGDDYDSENKYWNKPRPVIRRFKGDYEIVNCLRKYLTWNMAKRDSEVTD